MKKNMTRRDMLNGLGLMGAGLVLGGTARADETPIGNLFYKGFSQMISDIPHSMEDGPSAFLENGQVVQPRRTIPVFSTADVVVVGGGPAGFAAAVGAARAGTDSTCARSPPARSSTADGRGRASSVSTGSPVSRTSS